MAPGSQVPDELTERARRWAGTMAGHDSAIAGVRQAHQGSPIGVGTLQILDRDAREALEDVQLARGATRSRAAGNRLREEPPDSWRTCFERDRDRILHGATAFRRLAG